MRKIKLLILFIGLLFLPITVAAQNIYDYLIQKDIGEYKFRPKPTKEIYGNSGVVISAGHFDEDHDDISYITHYIKPGPIIGVDVQVTQHTGGDSDRWLLHEVEDSYRSSDNLEATLSKGVQIRTIDGKNIYFMRLYGDKDYTWLSNNVVVDISCNCPNTKPEPLEVVQAYLAKFPSTITLTDAELKASAHTIQWIKDEIDRRLWLCDKWNAQFQAGKTTQADLIYNLDRSMGVFLNYRQKYYGVKANADLEALFGYKQTNDVASINKKLTDYKTWWAKHKDKRISLP